MPGRPSLSQAGGAANLMAPLATRYRNTCLMPPPCGCSNLIAARKIFPDGPSTPANALIRRRDASRRRPTAHELIRVHSSSNSCYRPARPWPPSHALRSRNSISNPRPHVGATHHLPDSRRPAATYTYTRLPAVAPASPANGLLTHLPQPSLSPPLSRSPSLTPLSLSLASHHPYRRISAALSVFLPAGRPLPPPLYSYSRQLATGRGRYILAAASPPRCTREYIGILPRAD